LSALNRAEPDVFSLRQAVQDLMRLAASADWVGKGLTLVGDFVAADVVGVLSQSKGEMKYRMWLNQKPIGEMHPQIDVAWVEKLMCGCAGRYDVAKDGDMMAQAHLLMLGWGSMVVVPVVRPLERWLLFVARRVGCAGFTDVDLDVAVIVAQQLVLLMEASGSAIWEGGERLEDGAYSHYQEMEPLSISCSLGKEVLFDSERRILSGLGQSVFLTPLEARLLAVLLQHRHKLLAYAVLVQLMYGYTLPEGGAAAIIRPILSRLRKKLAVFAGGRDWIVSVRGVGLILDGN